MQASALKIKMPRPRTEDIRLLRAQEAGQVCWFYLKLNPQMRLDYERKLKTRAFDIAAYGDILDSGWGQFPPEDVVKYMKDEFDFDTPDAPK